MLKKPGQQVDLPVLLLFQPLPQQMPQSQNPQGTKGIGKKGVGTIEGVDITQVLFDSRPS